jgi:hypothetical protein
MPTISSVLWRWPARAVVALSFLTLSVFMPPGLARANEPTTLRVVSVTRTGVGANIVVSVPARLVASASGAFAVVTSDGTTLTPTVTALPPSTAAVAIVVDVADGSTPDMAARVIGAAAELIRSLDPGIPVAVASTRGDATVTPTTDRAAALGALSRVSAPVARSRADAVNLVGAQLAVPQYVDPMVVVFDAAATTAVTTPTYAAGIGSQLISVGTATDPVSLVDDTAGLMHGRFVLATPGAGTGPLTVRLTTPAGPLEASVPGVPSPPPAATPATSSTVAVAQVAPASVPGSVPASVPRSTPASAPPASTSLPLVAPVVAAQHDRSPWVWIAAISGVAVLGLAGVGLWTRRRRSAWETAAPWDPPSPPPRRAAPADPALPTPRVRRVVYKYTDFTQPIVRAPQTAPPPEPPPPNGNGATGNGATAPASPDEIYAKRLRVLALAEELGNISEACRIVGVSRRSFYEWKRIAEDHGDEALYPKRGR